MSKRGDHIQVIVNSEEKGRISTHADQIGMSASSFLRTLGLKAITEYERENGITSNEER